MLFKQPKIEWMHGVWLKNPEFEFQTRRVKKEGERLRYCSQYKRGGSALTPCTKARLGWPSRPYVYDIPTVYTAGGPIKWQTGRDYAIQPGRGKPGICLDNEDRLTLPYPGARRLRMLITEIREERLQDITEEGCLAEGIVQNPSYTYLAWGQFGKTGRCLTAAFAFSEMWDGIHKGKLEWDENPDVFALSYLLRAGDESV